MSFWTDFYYARPGQPPRITTADLAECVTAIRRTGIVTDDTLGSTVQVKLGRSIHCNAKPSGRWVPTRFRLSAGATCMRYKSIRWDIDEKVPSETSPDVLAARPGSVYRAFIDLGRLSENLWPTIQREPDEVNTHGLYPYGLALHMGPIEVADLRSDSVAHIGWIALSLSGPGYMWPWTLHEWRERAEGHPLIQALQQACQLTWPAPKRPPSGQAIAARKRLGTLFPYDLDTEVDWFWSVNETG